MTTIASPEIEPVEVAPGEWQATVGEYRSRVYGTPEAAVHDAEAHSPLPEGATIIDVPAATLTHEHIGRDAYLPTRLHEGRWIWDVSPIAEVFHGARRTSVRREIDDVACHRFEPGETVALVHTAGR